MARRRAGRIGVLIVNLGTPEATSYWPMRRYLKEFLSDRRVIETNRVLWWFILNGIILTMRPKRSGHAYEKIWNRERNESPLKTITRAQAEKLSAELQGDGPVIRRLGHALWIAAGRRTSQGAERAGLRPHPGLPALSAI